MFSVTSFLKNFSRMKRRWREELQLLVAIKRSFLSSYKWKKMFEPCRQLRLLPKQILYQSFITFEIIFTKWLWFANSFKCVYDGNVWPPGQRAEIRDRIASESLRKIRTKFYGVAGHVGRVKTVVTNHVKCFQVVYTAAERNTAARTQCSSQHEILIFPLPWLFLGFKMSFSTPRHDQTVWLNFAQDRCNAWCVSS